MAKKASNKVAKDQSPKNWRKENPEYEARIQDLEGRLKEHGVKRVTMGSYMGGPSEYYQATAEGQPGAPPIAFSGGDTADEALRNLERKVLSN